jgi:hypothetical protein
MLNKPSINRRLIAMLSSLTVLVGTSIIFTMTMHTLLDEHFNEESSITFRRIEAATFFVGFTCHAAMEHFFYPLHYHDKFKAPLFGLASVIQGTAFLVTAQQVFRVINMIAAFVWIIASLAPLYKVRKIPLRYDMLDIVSLFLNTTFFAIAVLLLNAAAVELLRDEDDTYLAGSPSHLLPFLLWTIWAALSFLSDCCMPFDPLLLEPACWPRRSADSSGDNRESPLHTSMKDLEADDSVGISSGEAPIAFIY